MILWLYGYMYSRKQDADGKKVIETLDKVGKIWYNIIVKRKKRGQNYEEKNQYLLWYGRSYRRF